ncbi:hypothetical protein [Thermococcus sp. Bubb.Bath]|uniref:hypothetical protein n=1 Tax=Thermococcus sp. Bubb.Bath TaxID=1638242 RepID=UPI0014393EEA|nr:hypothetical protein [Thermococcus sp. Bubb.Bath]NJF24848.1 hypothetical protein [Thermococcus sp. Bubb.Bath]
MRRYGKYLAGLFVGLAVLGLLSPAVSAGTPGSVTLKIQQKTWYAEADVYATIYYTVQTEPYGFIEFSPLGEPYNYIHFGSHSGTSSNAYWKSMDSSTSEYKHHASGWWHLDTLWDSTDGTMDMWLYIEYSGSSFMSTKNIHVNSIGTPYIMVRYNVDDSGGNTIADKAYDIAVGAVVDYVVSA